MRTYTFSKSELTQVNKATDEIAHCLDLALRCAENPELPIQPAAVRKLATEIEGAEGITVVADYRDYPSVGYVTLAELERAHEFTDEIVLYFERPEVA